MKQGMKLFQSVSKFSSFTTKFGAGVFLTQKKSKHLEPMFQIKLFSSIINIIIFNLTPAFHACIG